MATCGTQRLRKMLFQSPSHRGSLSDRFDTVGRIPEPAFQSPSHRGSLSDGRIQGDHCNVEALFQSPSHRGSLSDDSQLRLISHLLILRFNPLLIGEVFQTDLRRRHHGPVSPSVSIPFSSGKSFRHFHLDMNGQSFPLSFQSPSHRGSLSDNRVEEGSPRH